MKLTCRCDFLTTKNCGFTCDTDATGLLKLMTKHVNYFLHLWAFNFLNNTRLSDSHSRLINNFSWNSNENLLVLGILISGNLCLRNQLLFQALHRTSTSSCLKDTEIKGGFWRFNQDKLFTFFILKWHHYMMRMTYCNIFRGLSLLLIAKSWIWSMKWGHANSTNVVCSTGWRSH